MTDLYGGSDGFVVNNKKMFNEDGGDHTPVEKQEKVLSRQEELNRKVDKVMLLNKREIHNSELSPEKQELRNNYFRKEITNELLRLEVYEAERNKQGLPPLTDKDKTIAVKDGVVISKYREDLQNAAKKDKMHADIAMFNDALGVHSCHE